MGSDKSRVTDRVRFGERLSQTEQGMGCDYCCAILWLAPLMCDVESGMVWVGVTTKRFIVKNQGLVEINGAYSKNSGGFMEH